MYTTRRKYPDVIQQDNKNIHKDEVLKMNNVVKNDEIADTTEVMVRPFEGMAIVAAYKPKRKIKAFGKYILTKSKIVCKAKFTEEFGHFNNKNSKE